LKRHAYACVHHNIQICYLVTSHVYAYAFACARQGNDSCPAARSTQSCICHQGEYVHIEMAKFTAADGDNQLIESNVVSEYLDVQYRSSGVKLFPEDPLQLAKVSLHPGAGVISPHALL